MPPNRPPIDQRLQEILQRLARTSSTITPIAVFVALRWLQEPAAKAWQRGETPSLEAHISSTPVGRRRVLEALADWAKAAGWTPVNARYLPPGAAEDGDAPELTASIDGDPRWERLYRVHYLKPGLSATRAATARKKATAAPDTIVYQIGLGASRCVQCDRGLGKGALMMRENEQSRCLACCPDLADLVFVPSGDATLTRRSKALSTRSAVVQEWGAKRRGRKGDGRCGVMVEPEALAKAKAECAADAPARAADRVVAEQRRKVADMKLAREMVASILEQFPGMPQDAAIEVAKHTSERGSGRVGRTAAGRGLEDNALRLAVIAHIRHTLTPYDKLLATGVERMECRRRIAPTIREVLSRWTRNAPFTASELLDGDDP